MRRVVVTGMGAITPLSPLLKDSWSRLLNSQSGIKKIPENVFATDDLAAKIAGIVPDFKEGEGFNVDDYVPVSEQGRMDRFIHFSIGAAVQAVEDSGWIPETELQQLRSGVMIGSGIGGLISIENNANILKERGPRRVSPFFIPSSLINLASGHVSIRYNLKGPNHSVVSACATGAHAIGDAARTISCGDADVMVCGGGEAAICRLGIAGFASARALSTNYNDTPQKASRPWDEGRDGFIMGEGAGILVLEEFEHAKARGAKIYGELIGYGLTGDAYHITAPGGNGGYRAMKMALEKAKIAPEKVDYINAHGTSTPLGDLAEAKAIKDLFGHSTKVPISSTKSSIGHLLGAAGSVESIFCLMGMNEGAIPPTLNLDNPSQECDLDFVPHIARRKELNITLSNSFGFGGTNVSLIFQKI